MTASTKIVFIHLLNDYSGSPKVLKQTIQAFVAKGVECELFLGNKSQGFLSNLTCKTSYFSYKRYNNKYFTLFSLVFSQLILFMKLLQYRNADVVFYINTMLPFGAGLAGRFIKKRIIYHIHETYLSPPIFKEFLRYVIQRSATQIVFVSRYLQQVEGFDSIPEKIISNALPFNFQKEAESFRATHLTYGTFNVLMIGSLRKYKGIQEFFEIARLTESNSAIRFTIILNATDSEIVNYFISTPVAPNVQIISKTSQVIPYYKQSNLVLNLSRIDEVVETFGLTLLEAMAFGIPVIAPPVGGPAEIISDGREGFLISSYETEKISEKINDLHQNATEWSRLSENAKKRVKDFSLANFEKQLIDLLHD